MKPKRAFEKGLADWAKSRPDAEGSAANAPGSDLLTHAKRGGAVPRNP